MHGHEHPRVLRLRLGHIPVPWTLPATAKRRDFLPCRVLNQRPENDSKKNTQQDRSAGIWGERRRLAGGGLSQGTPRPPAGPASFLGTHLSPTTPP